MNCVIIDAEFEDVTDKYEKISDNDVTSYAVYALKNVAIGLWIGMISVGIGTVIGRIIW